MLQSKLQDLSTYNRSIDDSNIDLMSPMDGSSVLNDDIVLLFKNYLSHLEGMESIAQSSDNHNYRAIIKRQRDVLRELRSDYRRISDSIQQKRDRQSLLRPTLSREMSGEEDETQVLLKERGATQRSLQMADSFLEQASASHSALLDQRRRLQSSADKMLGMLNRIPIVNSVVRGIRNKKNKDNVIVAIVIALCIFFCIWYVFH